MSAPSSSQNVPVTLPTRDEPTLIRALSTTQAVALNMSNMVGVGPFITIPLIIATMGGPQCMLGWVVGAIIALCDGLVWSELAAALPGTGGSYVYLQRAFRGTALGGLLPFLFVWQFVLSGPLEIASGYIGFAQYAGYFWSGMGVVGERAISVIAGVVITGLLYRRIGDVGKLMVVLWIGMLVTVLAVIGTGVTHFNASVAFDFPPNAFSFSLGFATGLGSATLIAMYDFMGYYSVAFVAGEVRDPARTIPRSIVWSVVCVAALYAMTNLSVISVVPWREAMQSKFIVADFMRRTYGERSAQIVTALVMWTALASVFALTLSYSRIAYAAAAEGDFFRVFARLHPTGRFPHVSLMMIGALSIAGAFFSLSDVISALLTSRILVQFIGQIAALHLLHARGDVTFPFRMKLYPLPSLIALVGWVFVFSTSGWRFIALGVVTLAAGVVAYHVRSRVSMRAA